MFDTALANYDLGMFEIDQYEGSWKEVTGKVFNVVCVLVLTVIMLNFVIAILSDTYAQLSSQSLGLFYDMVIAKVPFY